MPVNVKDDVEPVGRAADIIARQLRRRIIRGELTEGDVLPSEADLLNQFGVSRPTLREAIRVLESESLVVVKRGSRGGIEVSVPRVEKAAHYAGLLLEYRQATTADVFAAAAAIEGPCVAMLARKRSADDLKRLREAVATERDLSADPGQLLELQNEFHRLVIDMAGNETLAVLSDVLRHIIELATQSYVDADGGSGPSSAASAATATRTHAKVVELIADKDAAGAEALWRKHILATSTRLRSSGVAGSVVDLLE
ncbi:FadR/GntR family transcriptional regulator [Mycobacterium sp. 050134]|uniref:FadR/GntR family transcriptional regulator n=1 Tax=Mycobacterium sp. 050134 TaxID=3096111 RepID=UPI002ED7E9C3